MRRLAPLLLAAACVPHEDPALARPRAISAPIPLKHEVAYVDDALDRVVFVDGGDAAIRPSVSAQRIGRRALWASPTPDRRRLLVVTRGAEAVRRGDLDEAPLLWDLDADGTRPPRAYPIDSPFDRVVVSADGRTAIAHFSEAGPDAEGFFRNPNELAVIDLAAADPQAAVTLRTLRSFGTAPTGVVLSPPIVLAGAADPTPRVFAFVLAPDRISIVDATHPERDEVTLRLGREGAAISPEEVVFAPRAAAAYVRSAGAGDVLEVLLLAEPPPDAGPTANDFTAQLAELGTGGGPADIAVYDDEDGRRVVLAATPSTRELVVIDADTGQFVRVPVGDAIDRITLFPAGDAAGPRTAVLAAIAARVPRVFALPLAGIDDDLVPRGIETIDAAEPVMALEAVPGPPRALLIHDDQRTVLGLLDIELGSIAPLQGIARLGSYAFTSDGTHLVASSPDVARLGRLELANLHPSDLRLDDAAGAVFPLEGGVVYVDHGTALGRATILPSAAAERADAHALSGFLLTDILEAP